MKPKLKTAIFISTLVITVFTSCQKERGSNKQPLAVAGPDQVITLPADSVLLDGSNSSDPDGRISAWQWTKVAGPASFTKSYSKRPFC